MGAKKQQKSKSEKNSKKVKPKDNIAEEEIVSGGIPDVDFKKFLGCGG